MCTGHSAHTQTQAQTHTCHCEPNARNYFATTYILLASCLLFLFIFFRCSHPRIQRSTRYISVLLRCSFTRIWWFVERRKSKTKILDVASSLENGKIKCDRASVRMQYKSTKASMARCHNVFVVAVVVVVCAITIYMVYFETI